jgi:inosose dehydratase
LIRFGNAPCSWGTIEGFGSAIPYSQMLDELKASGYDGTELGDYGFMPTDPAALRAELGSRGLTMLGAYQGVYLRDPQEHAAGQEAVLRVARLLAAVAEQGAGAWRPRVVLADEHSRDPRRFQNAGRVTPDMSLDGEGWRDFAAGADRIARAVRDETGLPTVFHHHCAGYVERPEEIERFLDLTDPSLVSLVFDTGHYLYGTGGTEGSAVLEGLKRFQGRTSYVHFKDCHPAVAERARREGLDYKAAVGAGVFCELGQGAVPFSAALDYLRQSGYDGWVTVEQDVLPGMGEPRESARRNREYLSRLEGATKTGAL